METLENLIKGELNWHTKINNNFTNLSNDIISKYNELNTKIENFTPTTNDGEIKVYAPENLLNGFSGNIYFVKQGNVVSVNILLRDTAIKSSKLIKVCDYPPNCKPTHCQTYEVCNNLGVELYNVGILPDGITIKPNGSSDFIMGIITYIVDDINSSDLIKY